MSPAKTHHTQNAEKGNKPPSSREHPNTRPHPHVSDTYEQRLILFLDFLGFKDIVELTVQDPARLTGLLHAMRLLAEFKSDEDRAKMVTQFSDSVVVSYAVTEESGVFSLVNEMALAVLELAYNGFLVRGAITCGLLIHTEDLLVGPAMVRAYEMESKEAIYPRVIMDPAILQFAMRHHAPHHSPQEELAYVESLMTKDLDDKFFWDYISWPSVVEVGGNADAYDTYLAGLARLIELGLSNRDPKIQDKYLWLHRRYLAAVEEILGESESSTWFHENREVAELVKTLPKFERLAAEATLAVAAAIADKIINR